MTPRRFGFTPAKQLAQGDQLSLADGRTALMAEVAIEDAAPGQFFTTYNFEVAEHHTYFVGKAAVWVHNDGTPCGKAFEIFVKAKQDGLTDVKALDKAHEFLRKASNLESDFLHHADDAENLIRKWLSTALKNDYPELDDATARYIGKKKWLSADTLPENLSQVADATAEDLRRVTPKQLAGIAEHHLLPDADDLAPKFKALGIDIEDFKVAVDKDVHFAKKVDGLNNGLHNNDFKEWIGEWNSNWESFFTREGRGVDKSKVFAHLKEMIHDYGLDY